MKYPEIDVSQGHFAFYDEEKKQDGVMIPDAPITRYEFNQIQSSTSSEQISATEDGTLTAGDLELQREAIAGRSTMSEGERDTQIRHLV
jgi:hypothetical protein